MDRTKYVWSSTGAVVARAAGICAVLLALLGGCGAEEDPGAAAGAGATSGGTSGAGTSGAGASASGTGGGEPNVDCAVPIIQDQSPCINTGAENLDCAAPDAVPPYEGACAPRDASCHRSSNLAKECFLEPNEPAVLEFRMTSSLPTNMPKSTGLFADIALARSRTCDSEQCLLMRTTAPRMNGEEIAGEGYAEIAVGRYNCDGTYSFYSDTAAPERADVGRTGASRWGVRKVATTVDPLKDGVERSVVSGMNPNRKMSCNAFYLGGSTDIDWEICTMGFAFTKLDTSRPARDGTGVYANGSYTRPSQYVVYAPLELNDADIIDGLTETFCQLLAFGPLPPDKQATTTCKGTPRCMPGSADCAWVKLPDSLCPADDAEAAMFGCHLGVKENVNAEEGYPTDVSCTDAAPTAPLGDLDGGQCCDPLGMSSTLPKCNAYRIVNEFSGAAAEITDDPKSDLQPVCM